MESSRITDLRSQMVDRAACMSSRASTTQNLVAIKGAGHPVIMDFGLAYSATEIESRLTGMGAILGTPTYMSPEQAMGDTDNISPAADIYSLGVICYGMRAGCVPFEGNVTAVLTKFATQEPKPLSEYGLAIDLTLVAIVITDDGETGVQSIRVDGRSGESLDRLSAGLHRARF